MASATRPMTADEFLVLPDEPGMRQELVHGEVVTMSPPGGQHGDVSTETAFCLNLHVKSHQLGKILAETGFLISRDPDTVRAPDVAFVRRELLDQITPAYVPFPPDLAIEVTSPNDRPREIAEKTAEWLAAGSRMVWNLHPDSRSATVDRPGIRTLSLGADDLLEGYDVVPGFRCRVGDLLP